MAIGYSPLAAGGGMLSSGSYFGSHVTHAAPYRSAEPVTPVVLTPEQHAKTVTVECGGRAYTYDAAGNHIGTDVEVTSASAPLPEDVMAQRALLASVMATPLTASDVLDARAGITAPAMADIAIGMGWDPGLPAVPLSPSADATFEAWEKLPTSDPRTIEEYAAEPDRDPQPIPARSSAWHRGLAKVRALVPR